MVGDADMVIGTVGASLVTHQYTRRRLLGLAIGGPALAVSGCSSSISGQKSPSTADYATMAQNAYIWGFPLVMMQTYLASARASGTPMNRLFVANALATPATKASGPNVDTLYGYAWLDLSKEPQVVVVPDTDDRYYSIQLIDAYTNDFAYIGRRATGTLAGAYAITAPGWKGSLPRGVHRIAATTAEVLMLTRTLVAGEADLPAALAVQAKYAIAPLSGYPAQAVAAKAVTEPLNLPILDLSAQGAAFFDKLGQAVAAAPPPAADSAGLAGFEKIGIGPGRRPAQDAADVPALHQAAVAGNKRITQANFSTLVNGWLVDTKITSFVTDPLFRAAVNLYGPGAHIAEEALYFTAATGSDGRPLTGTERYSLRFPAGELPPVDAFWSVTMYGEDFHLVANSLQRYAIGDRTKGLTYGADGSLDILIQHDAPAQGTANWLPAPADPFRLILRTYQPQNALISGSYKLPPLTVTSS